RIELVAARDERQRAQILPAQGEDVEDPHAHIAIEAGDEERAEVGMVVTVDRGQFCIEDAGSGAACLGECTHKTWIACGEVAAVPAVESDVAAVFVNLDAEAVELYLMRPAEAGRRFLAERRLARLDERRGTEHAPVWHYIAGSATFE